MLIKCPNCNAQYEVPNDRIPAAGRDVQCSSCSKSWFVKLQSDGKTVKDKISNYKTSEKGELPKFETTESFLKDKATKDVDTDVLEILREEADREIRAREVDGGTGETTQKLSKNRAIKNSNKNNRKLDNKALPDYLGIGSTLEETLAPNYSVEEPIKYKNKSGKIGFFVGIVIISTCWGVFSYADLISRSVPKTAIYMDIYKNYVEYVLEARDDMLQNLIEKLTSQR